MITGWFVRLTLILAILGVAAFEGVSIVIANVGVKDDAQSAAFAAAAAYQSQHTAIAAIAAAKADLSKGDTLVAGSCACGPGRHDHPAGEARRQLDRVAPVENHGKMGRRDRDGFRGAGHPIASQAQALVARGIPGQRVALRRLLAAATGETEVSQLVGGAEGTWPTAVPFSGACGVTPSPAIRIPTSRP